MRRVPLIPTLVVALAVAAMVVLGLWQLLDRAPKKEAYLQQLAANPSKPPIAFPAVPDDRLLFRRTTAICNRPVAQRLTGAGAAGFRLIADCGNGLVVQLGTTPDPMFKPRWSGGSVSGYISHAPDGRSLIGSLFCVTARSSNRGPPRRSCAGQRTSTRGGYWRPSRPGCPRERCW